jgi:carbon storage regulator
MLVLSRKPGERLIFSNGITVTVVEINRNQVRVGIDAPNQVRILRAELICPEAIPARDGHGTC